MWAVTAATNKRATRRILLIDDDEGTIQSYSRQLRLEGYQVYTAGNVEMGLFEAQFSRPDAIIVDFHMPLADGLAFLRRLRSQTDQHATPVAIMTGDFFLDDDVESEIQTLGGPLDTSQLGRVLMHEHIFNLSPEVQGCWPGYNTWEPEVEIPKAQQALRELKDAGYDTIVELSGRIVGRKVLACGEESGPERLLGR